MAFTRAAVLLKWNSGATERAFKVSRDSYAGGRDTKPASYDRSAHDGSLLIVRAPNTPRSFMALIKAEDSPSGTTGGVAWGSITELKAAWAATDLQVKSFEDSDYWNGEWKGDWNPVPIGPTRVYADMFVTIEEKD